MYPTLDPLPDCTVNGLLPVAWAWACAWASRNAKSELQRVVGVEWSRTAPQSESASLLDFDLTGGRTGNVPGFRQLAPNAASAPMHSTPWYCTRPH